MCVESSERQDVREISSVPFGIFIVSELVHVSDVPEHVYCALLSRMRKRTHGAA